MKVDFLLLLTFALLSCNDNSYSDNYIKVSIPNKVTYTNDYTLVLDDSLFVSTNNITSKSPLIHKIYNDSLFYFVYNSNQIAVLNLNNKSINEVELSKKVNGSIRSIDIISKDTIVIAQSFPSKILVLDIKNKRIISESLLKKISFKTENTFFNTRTNTPGFSDVNYNVDFNNLHYDAKTELIHVGLSPFDSGILKGFENTPRVGVFNYKTNNWIELYAEPKGLFSLRGDYTFGNSFLSYKNLVIKGDTTYINYKVNHKINYFINTEYAGEFDAVSKNSKQIPLPLLLEDVGDSEKNKEFFLSTPFYENFYYHKKINLYSRLYLDEQNAKNSDGTYKDLYDRKASIIFLDSVFNKVGEYTFPYRKYGKLVPISDGFLMFSNKYINTDENNEFFDLKYQYKIIKTKQ